MKKRNFTIEVNAERSEETRTVPASISSEAPVMRHDGE